MEASQIGLRDGRLRDCANLEIEDYYNKVDFVDIICSCKQRGICPSCDAKRAAAFAAFLKDELIENVGHCLWTFTMPKMLRPFFMRDRKLLSDLARLAYETIKQLMCEAAGGDENARPGVVCIPQTFGSLLQPNPQRIVNFKPLRRPRAAILCI